MIEPVPEKDETFMVTDQAFKAILENKPELYGQGVVKPLVHHTGKMLRVEIRSSKGPMKKIDNLLLRALAKRRLADVASRSAEVTPMGLYKEMIADRSISVLSPSWRRKILNSVDRISNMTITLAEFNKNEEKGDTILYQGPLVELDNTEFGGDGRLRILTLPAPMRVVSLPLSQYRLVPHRYFHPENGRKKQTRLENSVIKEYALYRVLDEISIVNNKGQQRKILLETILDAAGVSKRQIRAEDSEERKRELRRHSGYRRFLQSFMEDLCTLLKSEGQIGHYESGKGFIILGNSASEVKRIESVQSDFDSVQSHSVFVSKDTKCVHKHSESIVASTCPYSNISDIAKAVGVKQAPRLTAVPVPAMENRSVEDTDE